MDSDKSTTTNNNPSTRRSWRSRLIVEPLTVTFMLAYGLLITIRVEYLNKRLSEEANFTQPSGNTSIVCLLNTSSDEYERYVQVQTQTSYWTLYLAVSQSVPALFSANLLGALSDARGRRIAMVFPIIGFAVYAIVNALVAQLHWPLYALLAGTFALGLCGDFLTFVACSFAYVADTTTKKQRTYRMVILECLTTLGAGTGQVLVGFMIQVTGYPPVYYTILGIMVVSALYVFLLPESHPSGNGKVPGVESAPIESSPRRDLTTTKFVRSLADLFRPDPKGRCWKMVTYNYILFQSILIITAFLSISVLFAEGEPFCWSSALIGIFNGLTFIFSGFGLVVGGYVIRLCFSDHATMQASLLSFVSCLILAAFSKNNIMLFCVTAVGALRMLAMPICRAKMSKLIGPEEQGIMFACSGCIQSIGTLLSPVIFNALYPLTLSVSSGFIFVVMAITFSIPILLTLALQIDDRRRTIAYISVQNRPSTEYRETEHRVSED